MATTLETEPIPDRTDTHKAIRNVALRYSGHEAAMLGEAIRAKRKSEKLAKFAATGNVKDLDFTPEDEADMAVNLGNEYHYHQIMPGTTPAATPAATQPAATDSTTNATTTTNTTTVIDRARGRFRNWILAALLGAGLPLLGAGALAAYHWYFDKPENVTNITQEGSGQELDTSYAIHTFPGPPP